MILNLLASLVLAASAAHSPAAASLPDADCLECHADKTAKSDAGSSIYVDSTRVQASVHARLRCGQCHAGIVEAPHAKAGPAKSCMSCHKDQAAAVAGSAHASKSIQNCEGCHGLAHEARPAKQVGMDQCASCHAKQVTQYRASLHGTNRRDGLEDSPTCKSCHGTIHRILGTSNDASPVNKMNVAATCGECHANPDFLARHKIPFARPVEAYKLSVHGRALAAGRTGAPTCSDCHTSHSIFEGQDPRSSLHHAQVPITCGRCHDRIEKAFQASVHGTAVTRGVKDAPVCTDCHGEHSILAPSEPNSLVNPARVSTITCGRCHSDERLTQRYSLPTDKVSAYQDSYHGLAKRAGSAVVANCASCHGVHDILPSSDPRSTINPAKLGQTCGKCHPGAGTRFAIGRVHVVAEAAGENEVSRWVRRIYLVLIPLVIGFMALYVLLDFFSKLLRNGHHAVTRQKLVRMNLHFRIEHWLVVLSFPTLVITGFALKYPESWWSKPMLQWEAHFPFRGTVHRVAAAVMVLSMLYHLVHLALSRRDRIMAWQMIPVMKDATDMLGMIAFNLGLRKERPRFGMFSFAEKAEYLAFMWGSVVMAASGLVLWFDNVALKYLPKWSTDVATSLHFYEAVLASLAILIWHMYMVVFDPEVYPMDKAWLTGNASADHMRLTRTQKYLRFLRPPGRKKSK